MRSKNKNNWKFLQQEDGDFEEMAARQSRRSPNKDDNLEDFKKTTSGRNSESHSIWRERDNRSYQHNFGDTYCDGPEMADGGIAETSPFTQVLQARNSKTKKFLKCPPVIASGKLPRSYWEDKPMLVMKVVKRTRVRQYKDTPQNGSLLSSSSTEKEIPEDSGLVSEANRFQDGHQPEDRETNAADEMDTTEICSSQGNLREEDISETAVTKQTSATEDEDDNICGTKVQLLQTEQKAADEERKEKSVRAQEDSGAWDQLEDKNEDAIIEISISEMERCNQELQEDEAEYTKRIHQLGQEINTLKVQNLNFESRVQQLMEDKRGQTEQQQSPVSRHKDLLQQIENITEKEEEMEVRLHQLLLQKKSQMEDTGGQKKKRKKWFSLFFSKASKTRKETKACMEAETKMTGEAGEKKRSNFFINMFQRTFSSMKKKTCVSF